MNLSLCVQLENVSNDWRTNFMLSVSESLAKQSPNIIRIKLNDYRTRADQTCCIKGPSSERRTKAPRPSQAGGDSALPDRVLPMSAMVTNASRVPFGRLNQCCSDASPAMSYHGSL
jgi:hypothetical protein